ncbi:MAG: excisionase family DNA-binding protein [Candidatus Omnitrophota bacterium]
MSKKLMTAQELSDYLSLKEDQISMLVEEGVIPAYKIAGELLRFQKDQIDAIRSEIEFRIRTGKKNVNVKPSVRKKVQPNPLDGDIEANSFKDSISDFFYFNDFYIVSAVVIVLLLIFIFRG